MIAIGVGLKGGIVVRTTSLSKVLLGLVFLAVVVNLGACFANETQIDEGDPAVLPPGTRTLEPTPSILNEVLLVLVTVVLPTLF